MTTDTIKNSIKGTRTEKLVLAAFIAESTAYTRYTYYAKQAKKEEYYPIELLFRETAENELQHSKVFFKFLEGGNVEVANHYKAGVIGYTLQNLESASDDERTEGYEFYTDAAIVADEEGFNIIADHFRAIAKVERSHRLNFERYIKQIKEGSVWRRDEPIKWKCLECGYIHEGTTPPQECRGCDHPYRHYIALDIYDEP